MEDRQEGTRTRDEIIVGSALRNVGRSVLYIDRETAVYARSQGKSAIPLAAIIIAVCVSREGEFTGVDLAVLHPEHGVEIKRNVVMAGPSEDGNEPGYYEPFMRGGESFAPQQVDFTKLREIVTGGIASELPSLLGEHVAATTHAIAGLAERVAKLEAALNANAKTPATEAIPPKTRGRNAARAAAKDDAPADQNPATEEVKADDVR